MEKLAERKYDQAFQSFDNSGIFSRFIYRQGQLISPCGAINPGTGSLAGRIGNRITLTSLQIKLVVQPYVSGGGDLSSDVCSIYYLRCIIFTWRDDALPTAGDILEEVDDSSYEKTFLNIVVPLNVDKKVKRKILHDKTYTHYMNTQAGGAMGASNTTPAQFIDIYIPIRKYREVYYRNEEPEIEYLGVNKVYILLMSNVSDPEIIITDGKIPWPVYAYWRINYKDV